MTGAKSVEILILPRSAHPIFIPSRSTKGASGLAECVERVKAAFCALRATNRAARKVRKGGRHYDRPEPSPIKAAVSEVGLEWAQNRVPRGASEGTQTRNANQSGVAAAPRTFIFPGAVFRRPNRGAKMDPASSAG